MRILYIAPRYHTNQIPIVEGWLAHQDEVLFVTHKTNDSENHDILTPVIMGYSKLFTALFAVYKRLKKCYLPDHQFAVATKAGFPPYFRLKGTIRDFKPDIAILRERSAYTIVSYHICKQLGIPAVLYNQSPYYEKEHKKPGFGHRMIRKMSPQVRMTPIMGKESEATCREEKVFYAPFVMKPHCPPQNKKSFAGERVQIICVAGYHSRKQIPMLLKSIAELRKSYDIELTVAGEVITEDQREYYCKMQEIVQENGLSDCVNLIKNLNREQIFERYEQSDLFVLPSTRERASISQLEAMSCSLPAICSDTNGSACQIEEGVNGYLFRDLDQQDLTAKIEKAVSDRAALLRMGAASYQIVVSKHNFELYYDAVCEMQKVAGAIE